MTQLVYVLLAFLLGHTYMLSENYLFEAVIGILFCVFMVNRKPTPKSKWISVEGNISSGKTTLIAFLKEQASAGHNFGLPGYDIRFINEDISAWGSVFTDFYKDPTRWSLTFQFKVIAVRARQILATYADITASDRPSLVISERSLESSRHVFAKMLCNDGRMTATEKDAYNDCYDIIGGNTHTDYYIYCTTPPELCQQRYLKRAREGETLDLEYLKTCHNAHVEWLENPDTANRVFEIDSSEEVSTDALQHWYENIAALVSDSM